MKTSLVIIILILLNTTAIISEPISNLISSINIWWLISLELLLVLGYYFNKSVKDLRSHCEIDCNNLKLYIIKGKSA